MILTMVKLEILGLRRELHPVVEALQELGAFHLEEGPSPEKLPSFLKPVTLDDPRSQEKNFLERLEALLKELLPLLCPKATALATPPPLDQPLYEALIHLREKLASLVAEKDKATEQLALAKKYELALQALVPILGTLRARDGFVYTLLQAEKPALKTLTHRLEQLTHGHYLMEIEKGQGGPFFAAIAYPQERQTEVKDLLWKGGIDEILLPAEFEGKPVSETLEELSRRKEELPKEISRSKAELGAARDAHSGRLLAIEKSCRERVERYRILTRVAESAYTFYLTAWVPKIEKGKLLASLQNRFHNRLAFRELMTQEWEKEEVPVTLKNPPWLKPFELLTALLPPPIYGTMDATPFVALFFPFFFGLILGDVGYGLTLLGLTLFGGIRAAMRFLGIESKETLRRINKIGLWCSASSIFFGILFGEFFGTLGHGWLKPIWNDRLLITTQLLALSIVIGILHILLGLLLGISLGIRERQWRHVVEKGALLIFLAGGIFVANSILGKGGEVLFLSDMLTPNRSLFLGGGLMIASWIFLGVSAGMVGVIESFSIISNTLSYARLMALGIASVGLAKVANDIGSLGQGVVGILCIGAAVILHMLNMVIGGLFDPTIQSLRLNYVEFFTKFYQSGGREYRPFSK